MVEFKDLTQRYMNVQYNIVCVENNARQSALGLHGYVFIIRARRLQYTGKLITTD
jgi:hypothetical protein